MVETYVRLLCPECDKEWEENPSDLPGPRENLSCEGCHATRRLSVFARTERDLETLKQFAD